MRLCLVRESQELEQTPTTAVSQRRLRLLAARPTWDRHIGKKGMTSVTDTRAMYLDLMRRSLTRYGFDELAPVGAGRQSLPRRMLINALAKRNYVLAHPRPFDKHKRELGLDWPADAQTMVGMQRLFSLQWCIETVLVEDVPGDLIECGVWRGGASILMRAVLAAHGDATRCVWLADSFAGLPTPDAANYPADAGMRLDLCRGLAVPQTEVMANFERYGLLDDRVCFLPGWFKETLPNAPIESLAVLRLDGDLYESTIQALESLYPRLSNGGFCIIDDYHDIEGCQKAVTDYRDTHNIFSEIVEIDGTGIYWRKE